ncbi:MAG: hypothetical protein U0800_08175 [Isosphaeraceae bacterium]
MVDDSPEAPPTAKRGRGRPATGQTPIALAIRAKPEWTAWLQQTAEARGCNPTDVIDEALAIAAKRWKITPPPPRT